MPFGTFALVILLDDRLSAQIDKGLALLEAAAGGTATFDTGPLDAATAATQTETAKLLAALPKTSPAG